MNFPVKTKKLGLGCMRLPHDENKNVLITDFTEMVDAFMREGFNYFDTAGIYLNGKSELALKECLTSRYPRESFILTDKLSEALFEKHEDIRPFFESQLQACGVEYFDFYLMHAQRQNNYEKYKSCKAYETAFELKREGKIKHVGISFHDSAEFLDRILTEYPELEVVQLQFNYLDYDDKTVQSRLCYEVCVKHNKPVIVMEPVRGGKLVQMPDEAEALLDQNRKYSNAGYAIKFAASFDNIMTVLSGMSNMEQLNDNMSYMKDFIPLTDSEIETLFKVRDIMRGEKFIPCTACKYCTDGCPKNINIPRIFTCMNNLKIFKDKSSKTFYDRVTSKDGASKASECIKCGKCEKSCPQGLKIRELLDEAAELFE